MLLYPPPPPFGFFDTLPTAMVEVSEVDGWELGCDVAVRCVEGGGWEVGCRIDMAGVWVVGDLELACRVVMLGMWEVGD